LKRKPKESVDEPDEGDGNEIICSMDEGDADEVTKVSKKIKRMTLPSEYCRIKVRTLSGKVMELNIDFNDTIHKLKEKIEENEGIPPEQQRLIFNGKSLAENRSLKAYNITNGSILYLVLALRGG